MNGYNREEREYDTGEKPQRGKQEESPEDFPWERDAASSAESGGTTGWDRPGPTSHSGWDQPPRGSSTHDPMNDPRSGRFTASWSASGQPQQGNPMAIAGFICSLLALIPIPVLNIILWICGVVFSSIGLSRANNSGAPNRGLAIAGICISCVGILLIILFFVFIGLAGIAAN